MKNYAKILPLTSKIEHEEFTIPHNHQIILNKLKVNKSSFKILILSKLSDVKKFKQVKFLINSNEFACFARHRSSNEHQLRSNVASQRLAQLLRI